jgi:hypothetical protein
MPVSRRRLWLELRHGTFDELRDGVVALLGRLGFEHDERVDFFAGAFVAVALRPYWVEGRTAIEAHELLRADDPDLAAAIESVAPFLLGRTESREEQAAAIAAVEEMLRRMA